MQDEDTFEIYDPRNPVNKRRREESKKIMKDKKAKRWGGRIEGQVLCEPGDWGTAGPQHQPRGSNIWIEDADLSTYRPGICDGKVEQLLPGEGRLIISELITCKVRFLFVLMEL